MENLQSDAPIRIPSSRTHQEARRAEYDMDDGRGLSYAEYRPKTNLEAIPKIWSKGMDLLLWEIEKESGTPKTASEFLQYLDQMIRSRMKYDALTYLLAENIDMRSDSYVAQIDSDRIWMTPGQIRLFIQEIASLERRFQRKSDPMEPNFEWDFPTYLKNMLRSLKSTKGATEAYVLIAWELWYEWRYSLSLSRHLSSDRRYGKAHADTYSKEISEILRDGVAQCHTLSALWKAVLESGNIRWKLGIKTVTYLESPSQDHTILEITMKTGEKIVYDPTRNFLIQNPGKMQ